MTEAMLTGMGESVSSAETRESTNKVAGRPAVNVLAGLCDSFIRLYEQFSSDAAFNHINRAIEVFCTFKSQLKTYLFQH